MPEFDGRVASVPSIHAPLVAYIVLTFLLTDIVMASTQY